MKRRDLIVVVLGVALLCVGIVGAALYRASQRDTAAVTEQQPPVINAPPQALIAATSQTAPAQTQLPAIASEPPADNQKGAGKHPQRGSLSDGKETLSDGKEALPPVSELIGSRPGSVNPGAGAPPTEFLNKQTGKTNQLLDPPSLQNVAGPVVSPETR